MATESEDISTDNFEQAEPEEWDFAGLEAINRACQETYPTGTKQLQRSAVVKYWFGGPNPLDYIKIFLNPGDKEKGIPAHWHYITCGFSDLHGDGRVHQFKGSDEMSGYGFELSLRLRSTEDAIEPPNWPSILMNRLAGYVFDTGNMFHVGDHIPWHNTLDGRKESALKHLLVTKDPQFNTIKSSFGHFTILQLVGVTDDEMKAAQRWKGIGVLDLMAKTQPVTSYYITDMDRSKSIFEADDSLMSQVDAGIAQDGSNLGHVTAQCRWLDMNANVHDRQCNGDSSGDNKADGDINDAPKDEDDDADELKCIDSVHLLFDSEAAELLPSIVKGRLQKGRFFIFHNAEDVAIHFVAPGSQGDEADAFVSEAEPMKADGRYLQIYCTSSLLEKMSDEFECLSDNKNAEEQNYPKTFQFNDPTIKVTVSEYGKLAEVETAT